MKVRITYTLELSKKDLKTIKEGIKEGRINNSVRDFVWSAFVQGGEYSVNQEIYNEERLQDSSLIQQEEEGLK